MLLGHPQDPHWPAPEAALTEARRFLATLKDRRVVVVPHPGVEGLTAGVLALRALQAAGARVTARVPDKGEHAFSPAMRDRLRLVAPDALVILEPANRPPPRADAGKTAGTESQGANATGSPNGIPSLVVAPQGTTDGYPGSTLLSARGLEPAVNASLLTYLLASPSVIPGPMEWLAVLGTVAAHGADAPIPFMKDALRRAGRTAVTEAVSLLNAARRSSRFAAPMALEVLLRAGSATDITRGNVPGVDTLHDCRLEVQRETARCSKTPPRTTNNIVFLLFSSEAQVHPQVAVRWAQRLPDHIVIAANTGYLPGKVDFSVRSRVPMVLEALLATLNFDPGVSDLSLPQADFLRLAASLGFKGLRGTDVERRGAFPG
ncbi:hypothetical protein A176_003328 [Myxococcus hansupus]|uniref:Uncharacterized protein n=1 Tax=Pseudomyxococcus hansupus TaxID=1297742 RepID=A0A0H4WSG0_9BACT|nr:hypothetical protein [Myxococcus hansupus]AKQ66416.1 hypothetical protein A176_003328 [Myxococcus hansupus]